MPKLLARKKLRATIARRSSGLPDEMDYEEMSEPNMKLSRALLIVLVLHVVAVAGIIAFNTIKTRQGPLPPDGSATMNVAQPVPAKPALANLVSMRRDESDSAREATKPIVRIERAKLVEPAPARPDTGKTYVVIKGDNPVTIAKKLRVPYDDLIALNHIDDPRKLRIGQKLIIPSKGTKPKKSDE